ncbi:sensor histidine kinase [Desulfosarcina sp.]|uniref:sensor histidine kinase n=1 Tax=Desulfosarcina sp. TaxID=2027861 RepID=UPI003565855C
MVNNAVRHGKATAVTITLDGDRERMKLSVDDDGRGIPPGPETDGMGLRNMGFRANMIHVALDIRTSEGGGTAVQVSLKR